MVVQPVSVHCHCTRVQCIGTVVAQGAESAMRQSVPGHCGEHNTGARLRAQHRPELPELEVAVREAVTGLALAGAGNSPGAGGSEVWRACKLVLLPWLVRMKLSLSSQGT